MFSKESEELGPDPWLSVDVCGQMLDETREVASKALDRLRRLSDCLPGGVIEQLEQLHKDPAHERRRTARVQAGSLPLAVQLPDLPAAPGQAGIRDHSPRGVAVVLPCPAGVGTLLRIRVPPECAWLTVEVKHCRREGGHWVAGCELL